jgi:SAM-dependent methyltransferase
MPDEPFRLPEREIRRLQRTRRHPRPTQPDYLHARYLVEALERALGDLPPTVRDALDLYCGTRPYEDLLPPGTSCLGMDLTDFAGLADVVSDEFLPFDDDSFDLILCTEAFYYVEEPKAAVAELERVLRPGGAVVITVSLPWEYDRRNRMEHRYTGPELLWLFSDWDDVAVTENGGYAVSWAYLSGRIVDIAEERLPRAARLLLRPVFVSVYLAINAIGGAIDAVERRMPAGDNVLPMNLMLTARRPAALPPAT